MPFCRTLLVILLSWASVAQASPFWERACPHFFAKLALPEKVNLDLSFESGSTYQVVPMGKRYLGEASTGDIYSAKYFKEQGRRQFEVGVDGEKLLRWADGTLVNTCYPATAECPAAIFVMGENGKIYVYNGERLTPEMETIHHSSLLAGTPVASAGEIFVKDGKILELNDRSGHYLPPPPVFRQVLEELRRRGVDLGAAQISTH